LPENSEEGRLVASRGRMSRLKLPGGTAAVLSLVKECVLYMYQLKGGSNAE